MRNRTTAIAQAYADAIFHRVSRPIEPPGFSPNWADYPLRHAVYPTAPRFALAQPDLPSLGLADALERIAAPSRPGCWTFAALSSSLRLAHGPSGRRLAITWNGENHSRARYHQAMYGRGTASGGGLYPTELYLATGASGDLLPGVYHYASGLHALERLSLGDPTPALRQALLRHPEAASADQFLLLSVNFWKNAHKYNNFSYHVVTQDAGALLGSLRLLAAGANHSARPLLWFHDEAVNAAVGLDTAAESVMAVLPLNHGRPTSPAAPLAAPPVGHRPFQRSRAVRSFPMVDEVHAGTLVVDEPRPDGPLSPAPRPDPLLPAVELPGSTGRALATPLAELFRRRNSSFGRFSAHTPTTADELGALLAAGALASRAPTDLSSGGSAALTGLRVFVNHVAGIAPGVYSYDAQAQQLLRTAPGDHSAFLQQAYFLKNYNLAEVGALIVLTGRLGAALRAYGNRGLRVLNLEVGAVVQTIYLAGTALGLGCGAALGFDNATVATALGLDPAEERAMLWLMVGRERPTQASFDDVLF